ncbi:MAG: VCBS repeat-containing protein, partial [Bacteroidetes bacterium]|nr:VCBS repeat-containing protein [Bacteroidota bacterium]
IGFGVSVTTGDIKHDGWIDIYVANDFLQPDFFYINNGDGTFSEKSKEMLKHMSFYSMGADIADFNNDGLLDILVVDMMAEDNYRQKTMMAAMSTDNFWRSVEYGYHYQYMHNILQVNNGNGTFSEIANLSGIDKSDWSWNPILIDFDNDGLKDFFVTNGIKRDVTDNDFRDKIYNSGSEKTLSVEDALNLAPSTKISNVIYKNNGDLTFTKKTQSWGMDIPSFSNGAAYADFDLDGDLDLVINNVDEPAFLFRNNADRSQGNNYLRIDLVGNKLNMSGLGTKVKLFIDNEVQYLEHGVTKGYMSCQEDILHFGVGKVETIDSIEIIWLDGKYHKLYDVAVNQVLILNQKDPAQTKPGTKQGDELLFVDVTGKYGIDFTHLENKYDDYENEILLPHRMSQFGPSIAVGDVNGDGLDDFYIGGAAEQSGQLNVQNQNGTFIRTNIVTWEQDKNYEDLGALFFDADGDGDLDLYVVSGSSEFQINSTDLQDRLYINNGEGSFTRDEDALPQFYASGSCVVAEDYDQDGDQDLFVGGRVIPGRYPFPPRSYLLQNNGGTFTDVTKAIAPDLISPGMVTSAVWNDYDEDGDMDLVVVGEWMPISFYNNDNGVFTDKSFDHGMEYTTGWWNKVMAADIDMDGDDDFLLGNLGLNYKFKVSREEPLHIYCDDFDDNGSLDIVLGWYLEGECFPVRGRECSSDQMPNIKDKFKNYNAFGNATIADVYGDRLNTALQHYEANLFASSYMRNDGDGNFTISSLPLEAQFSTVFGILVEDFNSDGNLDVLVAGNFYVSEVETGRADAGIGLFMSGNNNGDFKPATVLSSGFFAPHDTRDLALLNTNRIGEYLILVANNNYKLQVYQVKMNGKNQGGDQLTLK